MDQPSSNLKMGEVNIAFDSCDESSSVGSSEDCNSQSAAASIAFTDDEISEKDPKRRPSSASSSPGSRGDFKVVWKNLTLDVNKRRLLDISEDGSITILKKESKRILQPQSGHIEAGTITALMGPSGAGKSSLLNCITGWNQAGVGGDIMVSYPINKLPPSPISSKCSLESSRRSYSLTSASSSLTTSSSSCHKEIKVAFVPQIDSLFPQFTVRETLIFSSRIKNPSSVNHEKKSDHIITALNLNECAHVKIGKCSGGQVKRVSIGIELISGPDVLILDEPTSGLDSSNAELCIRLLRDLAIRMNTAIVVTIHQPNHMIFSLFHTVYLLSKAGKNIYFGPPNEIIPYFEKFNLKPSDFSNPPDFAIDVASGHRFGSDLTRIHDSMAAYQKKTTEHYLNQDLKMFKMNTSLDVKPSGVTGIHCEPMRKVMKKSSCSESSFFNHLWLIFSRSVQVQIFRSPQLLTRMILNIMIAFTVSAMFVQKPGIEDGCWNLTPQDQLESVGGEGSDSLKDQVLKALQNPKGTKDQFLARISRITDNVNLLFGVCIYILLIYSIGTVLIIPLEIRTAFKEIRNKWYSTTTYFVAKTLADIPALVFSIIIVTVIFYQQTEQVQVYWRFLIYMLLFIVLAWVCESVGTLIGICFSNDLISATLTTMASVFPVLMFSGFLVRIEQMPWFFRPLTYVSWTRYAYEVILIIIYGYGRCSGGSAVANLVEDLQVVKSPVDLITSLWTSLNITSKDAYRISSFIGVENTCMESVINGTSDYLGLGGHHGSADYDDVTGSTPILTDAPEKAFQPSYVLSFFRLEESFLIRGFVALLTIGIIFRILAYIVLHLKINRTKN